MGLSLLELCALLAGGRARGGAGAGARCRSRSPACRSPAPERPRSASAGCPRWRAARRSSRRRWSTPAPPIRPRPPRARGARARASCSMARSAACPVAGVAQRVLVPAATDAGRARLPGRSAGARRPDREAARLGTPAELRDLRLAARSAQDVLGGEDADAQRTAALAARRARSSPSRRRRSASPSAHSRSPPAT